MKNVAKAEEAEGQKQLHPKAEGPVTGTPAEESEDELIEALWQNLSKDTSRHNDEDSQDEEIIEETSEQQQPREKVATYDPDPQLPGSPSRTRASLARVLKDARSMGKAAKEEDEHIEAERQKMARRQRIQSAPEGGKHSSKFDVQVRRATNEPGIKFQRGDAGRIRRDETHAINRILNSCTTASSSSAIGNLNVNRCSSEEGLGCLLKRLSWRPDSTGTGVQKGK